MSLGELVLLLVGGGMLLFAGIRFARHFWSEEAKWERRRRRSNSPIMPRSSKRPTVKFSVHTKSKRKK